jgi:hypothetical protein
MKNLWCEAGISFPVCSAGGFLPHLFAASSFSSSSTLMLRVGALTGVEATLTKAGLQMGLQTSGE